MKWHVLAWQNFSKQLKNENVIHVLDDNHGWNHVKQLVIHCVKASISLFMNLISKAISYCVVTLATLLYLLPSYAFSIHRWFHANWCIMSQNSPLYSLLPYADSLQGRFIKLISTQQGLIASNIPSWIVRVIFYGFSQWLDPSTSHSSKPPTYASVHPLDMIPTAAYTEQACRLSWFQFTLGRLSKKWSTELNLHAQHPAREVAPNYLVSVLIQHIWNFASSMWKHRNEIVHGATVWQLCTTKSKNITSSSIMTMGMFYHVINTCSLTEH
jgi:hypothetical protein